MTVRTVFLILAAFFGCSHSYSKYGRSCKDIGCLSSEVCTMAEDPCSLYSRDNCGKYPTCVPSGSNSGPSCATYVCPPSLQCILDNGAPKCVDEKSSSSRVKGDESNTRNDPVYPSYPGMGATTQRPYYPASQQPEYPPSRQQPSYPPTPKPYGNLYPSLPSTSSPTGYGGYQGQQYPSYPTNGYPGQQYPSSYPNNGYQGQKYPSGQQYPSQYPGQYPGYTNNYRPGQGGGYNNNRYSSTTKSSVDSIISGRLKEQLKTIGVMCMLVAYMTTNVLRI